MFKPPTKTARSHGTTSTANTPMKDTKALRGLPAMKNRGKTKTATSRSWPGRLDPEMLDYMREFANL